MLWRIPRIGDKNFGWARLRWELGTIEKVGPRQHINKVNILYCPMSPTMFKVPSVDIKVVVDGSKYGLGNRCHRWIYSESYTKLMMQLLYFRNTSDPGR
ncbi:hypothetical protein BJN42_21845 [Pseudomonas koreensis]|nr:hypothetical protein BJN42_21845 [Pseudomonas koreensis]